MAKLSYLALAWDDTDELKRQAVEALSERICSVRSRMSMAFDGKGLRVYCDKNAFNRSKFQILPNNIGLIAGNIFRRDHQESVGDFSREEADRVSRTQGKHLIERYWGGYVAFVLEPSAPVVHVLRDPTGGLPCLTAYHDGISFYFSSSEDVVQFGLIDPSINWKHVAVQLLVGTVESRETGLSAVSKVLGGECISHDRGRLSRTFYWHPLKIAESNVTEDPREAIESVRTAVTECVSSWGSLYDKLVLRLSGGLDSSIVLSCLRNAPTHPNVTCLTYYFEGRDSDERNYARMAARAAKVELIEQLHPSLTQLESILSGPRLAEFRYFTPLAAERSAFESGLAQRLGAKAFFDGHGGDGIFYQSPLELSPVDYFQTHGMDRRLFKIALGVARARDLSVWRVLRNVFKETRNASANFLTDGFRFMQLVPKQVMEDVSSELRFVHPWLEQTTSLPPGKLAHITYMSIPPNLDVPSAGSNELDQVTPIISQPLLECLLRVPTYTLTHRGIDRSIARQAFVGRVPQSILNRQTKGGVEDHAKALIARNMPFIRALLMDGLLVREGLLDRERLANAVSGAPSACPVTPVELLTHVSAEAWLQTWKTRQCRVAA